ncbi:hypothetical protein GCM10025870_33580 [Agromyces marinus]|uniref:HTH gntR-type domain-containing protein n=1 Tax=Agromyces marinus TaxID=1389020 RepID=A0ABN6YJV5_9MICO|nr:hypothetical protein GCM10025870_33580 [Agromyces marinus]
MTLQITGRSASDIAASVRALIERGALGPGDPLPSVRALADDLGVNRNTAVAAYGQLTAAGIVVTKGRGGTHVADRAAVAQEGFAADSVLRDVATGNPDPDRIPDPVAALARMAGRPVLYGEPVIDPGLERWARAWMSEGLAPATSASPSPAGPATPSNGCSPRRSCATTPSRSRTRASSRASTRCAWAGIGPSPSRSTTRA